MGLATVESEYLGGGARLTCSDRTAADVDTEIMETLKECYEEAKELLSGNRDLMDKLAAHLIEKETISGKEFMKIYRKEKGIPEPEEEDNQEKEKKENQDKSEKEESKSPQEPFSETGTEKSENSDEPLRTDSESSPKEENNSPSEPQEPLEKKDNPPQNGGGENPQTPE